jgi:type II secretory pathway pseudopilin PulG
MTLTKSTSKGFTLVELILIIILAGIIISVIAVRFVHLRSQIEYNTVKAIAESLSAASVANYQMSRTDPTKAVVVQNCQDVENTLPASQPLPSGYEILPQPMSEEWTICELRHIETSVTEQFVGHRAP